MGEAATEATNEVPFAARLPPLAAPSVNEQLVWVHLLSKASVRRPGLTLKCRFTSSVGADNDGVMYLCQPFRRDCKIPYRIAAAAVETLSDSTLPRIGRLIS